MDEQMDDPDLNSEHSLLIQSIPYELTRIINTRAKNVSL